MTANLKWRQEILARAEQDEGFRAWLIQSLRASPVLFINLICWTLTFNDYTPEGKRVPTRFRNRPFITWPCQDREIIRAHRCIESGESLTGNKTREMGWTWMWLSIIFYYFALVEEFHSLVASRKEEEVWKKGDPDTLFTKLEYLMKPERIPPWLLSDIQSGQMHYLNPATGSTIDGESTNVDIGRSGRRDLVFIDEAAAIDNLELINESVKDTAGTRAYISTPKAGSFFNGLFASADFQKAALPWYEHPGKGLGRRRVSISEQYPHGWTSPWYEIQLRTRTRRDLAQNVNMDLGGAGDLLFDPELIRLHREQFVKPARDIGDIVFANSYGEDGSFQGATSEPEELSEADHRLQLREWTAARWVPRKGRCAWKLWTDLVDDHATNMLRPPQDKMYVIAGDPGDGRQAANSTIAVFTDKGDQVAEFASSDYSARDFGRIMVAAAIWFGGVRPPVLIWETNGLGGSVTDTVSGRLRYPNVYYRKIRGKREQKTTDAIGWGSTPTLKRELLEQFADDISAERTKIRSGALLDEAATFVIYESGHVGQARLADLTTNAREAHGDRTIAGALASLVIPQAARFASGRHALREAERDPNTWWGREMLDRRQEEEEKRRKDDWRYW